MAPVRSPVVVDPGTADAPSVEMSTEVQSDTDHLESRCSYLSYENFFQTIGMAGLRRGRLHLADTENRDIPGTSCTSWF